MNISKLESPHKSLLKNLSMMYILVMLQTILKRKKNETKLKYNNKVNQIDFFLLKYESSIILFFVFYD